MNSSFSFEERIFSSDAEGFSLPRWNDLPDLELYMDQVITLINKFIGVHTDAPLTSSMINNYVKLGILPAPIRKKYSRIHVSRLIIICVMKSVLSIQLIGTLIDILLKNHTDEEILELFGRHYELAFFKTNEVIHGFFNDIAHTEDDGESLLSLAVMQAAAVSGGSKLLAEKALSELKSGTFAALAASDDKY